LTFYWDKPLAIEHDPQESPCEEFDDKRLAAPEKQSFITAMVIYVRRWEDNPIIGGIPYSPDIVSIMCLN